MHSGLSTGPLRECVQLAPAPHTGVSAIQLYGRTPVMRHAHSMILRQPPCRFKPPPFVCALEDITIIATAVLKSYTTIQLCKQLSLSLTVQRCRPESDSEVLSRREPRLVSFTRTAVTLVL